MDKLTISIYNTSMLIPAQTPLEQYGGAELICANLAKYFDETGHKVNLFAPEGSYRPPNGVLYQVCKPGTRSADDVWRIYWENEQSKKALKESDIILDSSWGYYPYYVANELKAVMHTHHGPHPGFEGKFPFPVAKPNLVGVSPNHAKVMSKISNMEWRGVCNGINPNDYIYREDKEDFFLFLGRWDWFKAPHRAVEIADLGKKKMILAGGSFGDVNAYVADVKNKISQSQYVKTYGAVGNEVRDGMPGAGITHKEKAELLSRAKAVVLPNMECETTTDVQNRQQWKQFIEPFGLVGLEANACFVSGTLINTPKGVSSIETLTRGDVVLDSFGFPTRVLEPKNRRYRGKIYTIKIRGLQPIVVTENHPILCRQESYPKWVDAGDIRENDSIMTPKLPWLNELIEVDGNSKRKDSKIKKIKINENFAELLGWYCADGYPSGEDSISFSLGYNEEHIKRVEFLIQNLGINSWRKKEGNCIIVYTGSTIFRRIILNLCGNGAFHKHIPEIILFGELELANSFLYGYFCGDGHKDKETSIVYTTVSNNLSRQTALLASRLNLFSSIGMHTRKNTETNIRGRIVHQRKTLYRVRLYGIDLDHNIHKLKQLGSSSNKRFFDEFGLWSPVESIIETNFDGNVYNIHTIRGTYLAENIAVHNCGTPAIMLPSGGWHHSLLDGYNGFFAVSNADFVDKMNRIEQGEIDPKNCRKVAEHFDYKRMGNNYLHLINKILAGEGW